MRKPHGPGWALVGDAGVTMDPSTAEGITNALRDATFSPKPSTRASPAGSRADTNRFLGTIAQTAPIAEFFAEENVRRIIAAGA